VYGRAVSDREHPSYPTIRAFGFTFSFLLSLRPPPFEKRRSHMVITTDLSVRATTVGPSTDERAHKSAACEL
jgi:hypothetical protein